MIQLRFAGVNQLRLSSIHLARNHGLCQSKQNLGSNPFWKLSQQSAEKSSNYYPRTSSVPQSDSTMANGQKSQADRKTAEDMLAFINASPTQFHAVEEASKLLSKAGYQRLTETSEWRLKPGGRYFFTRSLSSIVAFAIGADFQAGNGFHVVGAHTDSPCLKLKPVSKGKKAGYLMVNVEPYGGGLWHTWFDRDLSVAGTVIVRRDEKLQHLLVKIPRPICRIPMLAIHLQRDIYEHGFKPNKQDHLPPILATSVKAQLNGKVEAGSEPQEQDCHHSLLLELLAKELSVSEEDIVDFELSLYDTQPGVFAGAREEFIFVGRLDNLAMSYCSLKALMDAFPDEASLKGENGVKVVALFDHEEVGSASAQGAGGPIMRDAITRITSALAKGAEGAVQRALQNSLLVSADMTHAHHPNYAERHDADHRPQLHKGLVIKHNVNQRYATNRVSATLFREVGRRNGIPTQEFSVRSDLGCGSTVGPILAANLGCRTVDVGGAQLSMHSIREMCGVDDMDHSYRHFKAFFQEIGKIDHTLDYAGPEILGEITDTPCDHLH